MAVALQMEEGGAALLNGHGQTGSVKLNPVQNSWLKWTFGNSTRYIILALSTLCLSLVLGNTVAFNFTVICMDKIISSDSNTSAIATGFASNETDGVKQPPRQPMFTFSEESLLFSAVPAGTILGTIPISYLTCTFGVRKMFIAYGLVSAVATLFTPLAAFYGFWSMALVRILQGFAASTSYVAMGAISAEWSPVKDFGMYLCFISCHFQLAPMLVMPMAGELCESSWGWPSVYYILGTLTVALFTTFYWFYRDSPRIQKNVSERELKKIENGKTVSHQSNKSKCHGKKKITEKIPYVSMFKDTAVWGIFASNVGATFGNQIFWQYGPTYLNKALKMDITKTGFAVALPYVLSGLMKFFAGPLSDRMSCISQKARVVFFSSLSQYAGSVSFFLLVLISDAHPLITQLCFTSVTAFTGLWTVGVCKSTQLIACQFSHVIFSINTLVSSLIVLCLPPFVSYLVPTGEIKEWSMIFLVIGVIQALTQTVFNWTAEVEPRPWVAGAKKQYQGEKHNNQLITENGNGCAK